MTFTVLHGGSFTLRKFVKDPKSPGANFPKLTTAVKAAETRELVPIVAILCEEFSVAGDAEWRLKTLCIKNLDRFYKCMARAGTFPSASDRERMAESTRRFLSMYSALATAAARSGKYQWSMVNKFHFYYHLGTEDTWVNPACVWTYQFEDYQKHISKTANSCAVGGSIFGVNAKLVSKVRFGRHSKRFAYSAPPHT